MNAVDLKALDTFSNVLFSTDPEAYILQLYTM